MLHIKRATVFFFSGIVDSAFTLSLISFSFLFTFLMLSIHILVFFMVVYSVSECHTCFTLILSWTGETKVQESMENLLRKSSKTCLCLNSETLFDPQHASVYILYILDIDKKGLRYLFRELAV